MQIVECHYDGQMVLSFALSDRELKILAGEPHDVRLHFYQRLKRTLPDLAADDFGKFDYVVRLGSP